jgi:PPK2 family polyphosphate:nucleotide phosphotransferase
MKLRECAKPFRVEDGKDFRLKDFDPRETLGLKSKEHAQERLERGIARLEKLQEKLFAQDRWAILLILQAMDAAGKDSTIKHVMSGVNPQGCQVHSYKTPSAEELDHDFLWRTSRSLPERGQIGIFNRSYYEEVLVVRVHPELLAREKVPAPLLSNDVWKKRFEDINAFEHYLSRNGILVLKFFLHISKKEQKQRFLERLEDPDKNWKFSMSDALERRHWGDYMNAYEEMIRNTSTRHAPWYIVPEATISALENLNLAFPKMDSAKRKELRSARAALEREK